MLKIMKKIHFYIISFIFISLFSCKEQDVELYENNPGVYFPIQDEDLIYYYSFFSDPSIQLGGKDTIYLDVNVSGLISDKDRNFLAEVIEGDNTNGLTDQYKILPGIVKANEITGKLPIEITRTDDLSDKSRTIEIKLKPNEEFPFMDLAIKNYVLSYTSLITKPNSWDSFEVYFFGKYSRKWYSFIAETLGVAEFIQHKKDWWDWYLSESVSSAKSAGADAIMTAYETKMRITLRDYNNSHAEPFKHDDGEPVVMP